MSKRENRCNRSRSDENVEARLKGVAVVTAAICSLVTIVFCLCYWIPRLNQHFVFCEEVGVAIQPLKEMKQLVEPVDLLTDDLPKIVDYLSENLVKSADKEVDFILQIHAVPFDYKDSHKDADPVLACQHSIVELLTRGKYELVGSEGFAEEVLSIEELDKSAVKDAEHLGYKITPEGKEKVHATTLRDLPLWGVLNYVTLHPTPSIGTERYSTVYTHTYLNMIAGDEIGKGGKWYRQADLLSRLRSRIALARIFERLEAIKKTRAVLVIGYDHRDELEKWRRDLGFGGKTMSAIPASFRIEEKAGK